MFIDEVSIKVKGGHGGAGTVSFRHEKYEPMGGPDGGDGGHGADVILRVDHNLKTLLDLRYKREYSADPGARGMGKNMRGKDGEDLVVRVPAGTMVFDHETRALIADLTAEAQEIIIAPGGMGGKGNAHFKTSTNRAPRMAQPGMDGEARHLDLELKLIADVGLVGKPNAGKSTLLSRLSAARPKIANYPFTTLEPQLGIVKFGHYQHLVMADIPGIIEGAHQGKGLGLEFLKHIERTKILVLMVDVTSEKPAREFEMLLNELRSYSPTLAEKPIIYCLTKTDLLTAKRRFKKEYVRISAVTGSGLEQLVAAITGEITLMPRSTFDHWLALLFVKNLGSSRTKKLITVFQTPQAVFTATEKELREVEGIPEATVQSILAFDQWDLVDQQRKLIETNKINVLLLDDPAYPRNLREIEAPPYVLFCRGELKAQDQQAVAMVGTRQPTRSGCQVTETLAGDLARAGLTIVSGMARGIDACAHQAALTAGGRTIAVLGCGADIVYPPEHKKLMDAIMKQGAVISEFPLGTEPDATLFPRRNRIISGLAWGVVVVEAPEKSGALFTAGYARKQDRKIFAVPGSVHSGVSKGTNNLLKEGALLVVEADDVLDALPFERKNKKVKKTAGAAPVPTVVLPALSTEETRVFQHLSQEPVHIDDLATKAQLPSSKILSILLPLELKGLVVQSTGKMFARNI